MRGSFVTLCLPYLFLSLTSVLALVGVDDGPTGCSGAPSGCPTDGFFQRMCLATPLVACPCIRPSTIPVSVSLLFPWLLRLLLLPPSASISPTGGGGRPVSTTGSLGAWCPRLPAMNWWHWGGSTYLKVSTSGRKCRNPMPSGYWDQPTLELHSPRSKTKLASTAAPCASCTPLLPLLLRLHLHPAESGPKL